MQVENTRMDILSRKSYPKDRLFRFVVVGETPVLDEKGDMPGRGIYLLKDEETLDKAEAKLLLEKRFRLKLPEGFYAELRAKL